MIKFNKNSWHYRLATVYGTMYSWEDTTDICKYTSSVLLGSIFVLLLTFVLGLFSIGILDLVLWTYFVLNGYSVGFIGPAVVVVVAVSLLSIFGFFFIGKKLLIKTTHITTPSFIKEAYYSWKDKYCFRVEFK